MPEMVVKIWIDIWNLTFWGCMELKILPLAPLYAWNGGEYLKLHLKHDFLVLNGVENIATGAIRCLKWWWIFETTSETWLFGVVWSWKYCHQRHQMPEMVVKFWNYIWNMTFWGCLELKILPPAPSDAWNGGENLKLHLKHDFLGLYGIENTATSAIRCLKWWWNFETTPQTWVFGVVWSWKYCHRRH